MSGYQYSIMILESEIIYNNNSNALSIRNPVLGEERLRFVLCVPFRALTVHTDGWVAGKASVSLQKPCSSDPGDCLAEKVEKDRRRNRLIY